MTTKTKRLSDQTLIFQAIAIVREELAVAHSVDADSMIVGEIMERLGSLYACIDTGRVADILKQFDNRGKHGQ